MSAELERSGSGRQAAARYGAGPSLGTYVFVLALILVFTVVEIAVLNLDFLAGVQKPLIVALLAANFTLAALYYQGLQYEDGVSKLTFGVGVALGLLTAVSLVILLPLGLDIRP